MSAPETGCAALLYSYCGYGRGRLAELDAANNYAFGNFCTALMSSWEVFGSITGMTTVNTTSAWSDPAVAPDALIENMAMRRGLRGAYGETVDRLRDRLLNPPSAEVGSSEAIAEAVRGILGVPGADVSVDSNYAPVSGVIWGHTTVTVDPDDSAGVTLDQIQLAAEDSAPDWIVIHAVIAEGLTIDELTDDIDDYTSSISEL